MGRSERQDQVIFVGGRLQFKIKTAAEAFAQRQTPGLVHPGTKGCMDNEMHVTGFIEEAFEYDGLLTRYHAKHGFRRRQVCR